MIPRVDNTAPDMFALGCRLVDTGCLSNIDRKLALRPVPIISYLSSFQYVCVKSISIRLLTRGTNLV